MAEGFREEVVIVGMAGRFPGAASVDEFWANLQAGVESIRRVTAEELSAAGVDPAQAASESYVAAAAPLEHADAFDAAFFGYTPRDAALMDPQHRVFLECAWAALEDAGHDPASYPGTIGLFGGVAPNTYRQQVLETRPDILRASGRYPLLIGSEREYAITRAAFKLGLRGPAIAIGTACSTSGVALHLACQSVLSGECDMALAGGARVAVPLAAGYVYEEDGILSPDGHCRAFDAAARGTVVGSGAAIVVVKRLSDAVRDGDTIRAIVRGTAINNDGEEKLGFTAPGVRGQEAVIRQALDMADVDASSIGYVEAHGTGTFIGDPIEVQALTSAYRSDTPTVGYCGIGSVKTNIGHLDAGAGVAGVIKTVLALETGTIPASLNYTTPNPQIDFAAGPFRVIDRLTDWPLALAPRRAAVSSFGLGGTNAHIILEQAPTPARSEPSARDHQLLVLSARTEQALDEATDNLVGRLEREPELELADVAHTLALGRRQLPRRRTVVARDAAEAARALRDAAGRSAGAVAAERPILFLFPGGGAQHAAMAVRLYATEPEFRRWFDRCDELAQRPLGQDLRALVFDAGQPEALERPTPGLLALFAVEYATARLLESLGVRPDLMIGHSLGEYTAACLAGVMRLEDAVALVALRGELFESLPAGAMLSVPLAADELQQQLGADLSIAAINKPELCTVAGGEQAVAELARRLEQEGIETRRLRIAVAAHSHLVEPILDRFGEFAASIAFSAPLIPFVSNLTGALADADAVRRPDYWVAHLRNTVRFVDGLGTALGGAPKVVVEVGPGQVLSGFARQHPARLEGQVGVAMLPHPSESTPDDAFFLAAVGKLWTAGVAVELAALHSGEQRRRVPLPAYPFERARHWIDRGDAVQMPAPVAAADGATAPAPAVEHSTSEPPERRARIHARLVEEFCLLSGLAAEELDSHASFLELGFDSLFMTQAAAAIGSAFSTRVSFRLLVEEAPTLDALAGWLDDRLPQDAFAVVADAVPDTAPSGLDQIAAQLSALQQQVAALTGGSSQPSPGASVTRAPAAPTGPWRPPELRPDELGPGQREHVAALTQRLTSRSPGSKAATAANRRHLADPRTVAGFRRSWKELVYPVVAERSAGSKLWDVDGNEYLDIAMGFGVNLFGHSPDFVVEAVTAQLARGMEIGPQTPLAGETAGLIAEMTGHERVAFCNTGSEAVLAAMRLARTVTGQSKIVTFANDYHGLFDEVLARGVTRAGERRSLPIAPGIPEHASQDLIIFDYGDPEALQYIADHASELAAVLVEPVQSRHPELRPIEFLRELRQITASTGVGLVFDEMITGFRSHPGGAQALFGIKADLATYGKVIGGGFPIGVVAGAARFMDALDGGAWSYGDDSVPEADVTWFAGTFVRHPIALAAARAVLTRLQQAGPSLQAGLDARTTDFAGRLNVFLAELEAPIRIEHFSSLFLTRFERDQQFASLFYFHLRDQGVHVTEGRAAFLSTAHTDADLERLEAAYRAAATAMKDAGFLSRAQRPASRQEQRELPVTEGQQEILLAAGQSAGANCAYNLANTLHITGSIDVDALRRAFDRLVARHEALRVTFTSELTHQRVAPTLTIEMPLVDLSELGEEAREAALADHRATEVETPFDLHAGPLIRARLLRMAPLEHHLFLTVHHAVCDGWSSSTLLRDLAGAYTAERRGVTVDPTPAMQLGEYVEWFHRYRTSDDRVDDERFWSQRVLDFPTTDLPADRPRPARRSFRADRRTVRLGRDLTAGLRRVATEEGTTLFCVLLGSFECLLARLTESAEVGLGISIAGHTQFPGRNLVAHCVNLIPLRRAVNLDASFSEHLATTRTAFLDAFEHQNLSYGELVRASGARRDPARTPLVSITFNMDSPADALDLDGAVALPGSNPRRFENFDVFVNVIPHGDDLLIECTHNLDLFDTETIDRRLDGWTTLLANLMRSGAAARSGGIDMVPLRELALLKDWNATREDRDESATLVSAFASAVARHPDSVAVEHGGREVSYGELGQLATRVARHLVDAGVRPGDMVGVLCDRSVELVAALHGVLMAAAAYVPLDPEYPVERLDYMVSETEMPVLLCQRRFVTIASNLDVRTVDLETLLDEEDSPPLVSSVAPDQVACVIYTSGSTGRPKGVANSHAGIANQLSWMQDRFRLGPGEVVLQKTPFSFDVSMWELFWPLQAGARLVMAEPGGHRDPAYLVETIVRNRVTMVHFVPSMLRAFLDDPAAASCTSLRRVICAGEALTRDLQDRFFTVLPDAELHNLYGPTEAAISVTARECRRDDVLPVVPIGAPIANTTIHILDKQMKPVPIGIAGELHIGGVQVAVGYVNQPELTRERFVADPFDPSGRLYKTGDIARWLPGGQIDFLGRSDNQVKLRGHRIELGEIEATLGEHPTILDAAVVLRQDHGGDAVLVAYLVPRSGKSIIIEDVRDWLRQRLPASMIPARFAVLLLPPQTTSGKLDRGALPPLDPIDAGESGDDVAPRTDMERDIAQLWCEVLGTNRVGVESDFFDLGGHSLKLLQLIARFDEAFGVRPALTELFETATVAEQAVLITDLLIGADGLSDQLLAEALADIGLAERDATT